MESQPDRQPMEVSPEAQGGAVPGAQYRTRPAETPASIPQTADQKKKTGTRLISPSHFFLLSELLGKFFALYDLLYLWFEEDTRFDFCFRQFRKEVLKGTQRLPTLYLKLGQTVS